MKKSTSKLLSIVMVIESIVVFLILLLIFCQNIEIPDSQHLKVLRYIDTEMEEELTIEKCTEYFGEAIWVNELGLMEFNGGSSLQVGFFCYYREYVIYVTPTEDGKGVESAYYRCVYRRWV